MNKRFYCNNSRCQFINSFSCLFQSSARSRSTARLMETASRREQFTQSVRNCGSGSSIEFPQALDEACLIHGPKLVDGNLACLALKCHRHARRPASLRCRHGSDNNRSQVAVDFIRRDNDTGRVLAVSAPVAGSNLTRKMANRSITKPIPPHRIGSATDVPA